MRQILIIEDNIRQLEFLIENAIEVNPELEVKGARSIKESIEIVKNYKIDAFFIDIQLLDGSGLDFAKYIRENREHMFTPIVFITAIPTKEMEAFHDVHCYDYIFKPFTKTKLKEAMKKILIDYFDCTSHKKDKNLYLEFKGFKQCVRFEDIILIEYESRRITITTKHEKIKYKQIALKSFLGGVCADIIQVHQSIAVNKLYIDRADLSNNKLFIVNSDIEIPIGRKYKKMLEVKLNEPL